MEISSLVGVLLVYFVHKLQFLSIVQFLCLITAHAVSGSKSRSRMSNVYKGL